MSTKSVYAIGRNLRQLRKIYGFTQVETAKRLNICRTSFLGYETGSRIPGIDTLLNISDLFDVSMDLLCESNPEKFHEYVCCCFNAGYQKKELLEIFKHLTPLGRAKLLEYAKAILRSTTE